VFVNGALSVLSPFGAAEVLLDVTRLELVLLAASVERLDCEASEIEDELSTELVTVWVVDEVCVPLLDGEDVPTTADCVEVVVDIELAADPGKIVGIKLVCALVLAAPGIEVGESSTLVVAVAKLLAFPSALLTTASGIGVPASPHANCNGLSSTLSLISLSH